MIQKDMNAGKVVLIIGGTSGIGRATAILLPSPQDVLLQDSLDLGDGGWIRY
jgi:hypothetical protein